MTEEKKVEKKKVPVSKMVKKNPWILSTIVLAIVSLILLFALSSGSVSQSTAGDVVLEIAQQQLGDSVTLSSVEPFEGDFYLVTLAYEGQESDIVITKDGLNLIGGVTPVSVLMGEEVEEVEQPAAPEVTKSDRPSAELYIWSYCPYGVTALGPFADVAMLLGDLADFKVYLYYAGHGDFEVQQNKIQACIQDLGYTEEYWSYAKTFANEIYETCYGDVDCDLEESISLMNSVGIDSEEVLSCVDEKGDELLDADFSAAKELGVTGSPTLIVNEGKVSVARTSEAFKGAVCSAFNTIPETCGEVLDSTTATTTGSC